ncbi:MAG: ABC transporter permease [Flavobacteriaceae bacterium]|nr:ABC transporter permease [Flavobacteriaceae bacterium]
MNFPFHIAKRYLFSKSSNNAINIITGIAAVGVIVGAMSLFIVLSGFSGLKEFSLQFTNVFDSDLKIYPAKGKTFDLSSTKENSLSQIGGIDSYSRIIEERIFIQYKNKNEITYIKGVDHNYANVVSVDSILYVSDWFIPGEDEVVIGLKTANKLSLGNRDYMNLLELYVPKPYQGQRLDPSKAFNKLNAVVSGIYHVNEDLDNKYVFTDIDFARTLLELDSTLVSSIELKLVPQADENVVREKLHEVFGQEVIIKNRIQQNDALYKMLNTENIAVYLIFTLVLIIALFNVIGSIIMMILDKKSNMKTLFNLGATLQEIRRIFFLQGLLMSTLGGVIGISLGVIAVIAQLEYGYIQITETLPYPVQFDILNVLVVFVTITILGVIASKIAATRVSEKLLQ